MSESDANFDTLSMAKNKALMTPKSHVDVPYRCDPDTFGWPKHIKTRFAILINKDMVMGFLTKREKYIIDLQLTEIELTELAGYDSSNLQFNLLTQITLTRNLKGFDSDHQIGEQIKIITSPIEKPKKPGLLDSLMGGKPKEEEDEER